MGLILKKRLLASSSDSTSRRRAKSAGKDIRQSKQYSRRYVEIIEVDCTEPIHYFKTYYGRVDAVNSILAIFGMDRKSRRKTFRVPTLPQNDHAFPNEYGLARIDRLVFYNAYAIWREVHGNQGINLQDSRYGFRAASLECVREFA